MTLKLAELAELCLVELYLLNQTGEAVDGQAIQTMLQKFAVTDTPAIAEVTRYLEANGYVEVIDRGQDEECIRLTTFGTTTVEAGGSTGVIRQYLYDPVQFAFESDVD